MSIRRFPQLCLVWGFLALPVALSGIVAHVTMAAAQGIQLPTARVQTDRITQGIQTNLRLATNAELAIKPGEAIEVHALALSSPRYLVTGLGDGSVRIWDLELGRETATIAAHRGDIRDLAIGAGGRLLATGGEDGYGRVWDLATGDRAAEIKAHDGAVAGVALDPSGGSLITAGADGAVRIWDLAAGGKRKSEMLGHVGTITSMAMTEDGLFLVTGGADKTVRVWDLRTGKALNTLIGHDGTIRSVAVGGRGELIASSDSDGRIVVWDRTSGAERQSFRGVSTPLSVAINGGRGLIGVGGTDSIVRLYDLKSGEETRSFRGHAGPVRHLAFEPTNQFLHTASVDGTSRVWDLPTGDQLAQVISTNSGWVVADASGSYDGSDGGVNSVEWVTSEGRFDLDQQIEERYEPGLLAELVENGAETVRRRPAISDGFPMPPRVSISTNGDGSVDGRPAIDLSVVAENDGSGGVSELRLYHNGKLIGPQTVGIRTVEENKAPDEHTMRLQVPLVPGRNQFQAVALNAARVESKPANFTVSHSGSGGEGVLHLIVVGIDKYRNPALNLNYGVLDGRGIAEFFKTVQRGPFAEVRVYELYDEAATKEGILGMLDVVRDTKPEDVVVVFLAGHGEAVERDWFFVPHELVQADSPTKLAAGGIASADIRDGAVRIGARKVLVMIDTCKSGTALQAFRGFEEIKALRLLARWAGLHIVASADNQQLAAELASLGHGVFTYAALQGLKGAADQNPVDGRVSVGELIAYVQDRVPDLALGHNAVRQDPVAQSEGADFTIATPTGG